MYSYILGEYLYFLNQVIPMHSKKILLLLSLSFVNSLFPRLLTQSEQCKLVIGGYSFRYFSKEEAAEFLPKIFFNDLEFVDHENEDKARTETREMISITQSLATRKDIDDESILDLIK